jgi:hypothetical protein
VFAGGVSGKPGVSGVGAPASAMLIPVSLCGGKPVNHYNKITLIQAARAGSLQIEIICPEIQRGAEA